MKQGVSMSSVRGEGQYGANFDAVNSALRKLSADMARSGPDTTDLKANVDKLLNGGTSSFVLRGHSDESPTVKVRFVGEDYRKKIQEINKEITSLSTDQRHE